MLMSKCTAKAATFSLRVLLLQALHGGRCRIQQRQLCC